MGNLLKIAPVNTHRADEAQLSAASSADITAHHRRNALALAITTLRRLQRYTVVLRQGAGRGVGLLTPR